MHIERKNAIDARPLFIDALIEALLALNIRYQCDQS